MQINISARHGELNSGTKEKIEEKVQKLTRFFDRLTAVHVTADMEHREDFSVELRASAERAEDFVATDSATSVLAALDGALHKLERQLRRHKEKLKIEGHRAQGHKHIESPDEGEDDETE